MSKKFTGLTNLDLGVLSAYELLEQLDRLFPRNLIQPNDRLEDILFYAGKRDLIETLLMKKEREQNG